MVRKSHVVYYPSPFSQGFFLLCFFVFSQHGPFSASCILLLIYRGVYIEIKFFFITLSFMCYKHQVWILNHTPHDYNTQDIPPPPPPPSSLGRRGRNFQKGLCWRRGQNYLFWWREGYIVGRGNFEVKIKTA